MEQQTINWGILSTAKIGRKKVVPALLKAQGVSVTAIASRSLQAAKDFAGEFGIPKTYGTYAELLADPDIDVIYNPLPNNLHIPLTIEAVRAGKHVLCEKPIAMNAEEAKQLQELPRERLVMEAFMVRAHPQWQRAREIVRAGELGELWLVQGAFCYNNTEQANIRNQLNTGGGGLMDIGCYPIVASRYFFEAEPARVLGLFDRDPHFCTDRRTSCLLDYGDGRRAEFSVSTQSVPYQRLNLIGTKKRLEILIPFNAPENAEVFLRLDDGAILGDRALEIERIEACDQYQRQAELFSQAVRGEENLPYGVDDAIQNMRIIDAIVRSEASGAFEAP
ncbi:Gfo/Idh/MocA family protein [Polycladidibacter stylochi]|uniref:Gfo/Idh/MocA family protein n=1 Tax=Polycladidibacter stylochi TaxID=1807766 RepID=UPI00082B77E1|nr:Gfo/Idh/MocA family oxidoreductase [Pseudovibrio stylochi]